MDIASRIEAFGLAGVVDIQSLSFALFAMMTVMSLPVPDYQRCTTSAGYVMAQLDDYGTVLLSGVVGSIAYGLAGDGSDVDRLGMFAAPTRVLLGLRRPPESHVTAKPDATFHEVGKAARLMLAGNPTATELLWLPDDLYETRTALGEEAIELRGAFLSAKRVHDAYLGYATQQFRKLISRADQSRTEGVRGRTAKHARHLMRLVEQGLELYTTGTVMIRLSDPERYLAFGEQVAADPQAAAPFMASAEERFDRARTVLPAEPDTGAVEAWLLRVRRAFWDQA